MYISKLVRARGTAANRSAASPSHVHQTGLARSQERRICRVNVKSEIRRCANCTVSGNNRAKIPPHGRVMPKGTLECCLKTTKSKSGKTETRNRNANLTLLTNDPKVAFSYLALGGRSSMRPVVGLQNGKQNWLSAARIKANSSQLKS